MIDIPHFVLPSLKACLESKNFRAVVQCLLAHIFFIQCLNLLVCVVTSILAQSVRSGNFSAGRTEPFLCIEEIVPLFLFVTGALLKIAPPPFLSCSLLFIPLLSLAETPLVVQLLVVEVVVVVVVAISEVVALVSPKNSSNLSLLTANTVPLSAHFPINVNARNGFFFFRK